MRRAALILLLLLSTSCGDPRLTVVFDIGPEYRDSINNTAVRIYEPLVAAPFDCEALAFGEVDEDVLRLSLVSESSQLTMSLVPLGDIDRTAAKLFWVEGFDGEGRRLVTGCAELGEIDEDTELLVPAEPTKLVVADQQQSISVAMGGELQSPITLTVTDVNENPLEGAEIRWEIDGAGGSGSNGVSVTDAEGIAQILPSLPTRPGPFVLDVATRWAEVEPPVVTGFVTPEAEVAFLPGSVYDYRPGRVGPNGEAGFAALIDGDLLGYKVAYVYANAAGELQTRISQTINVVAPVLGVIVSQMAGARDRAIVIGVDEWVEVETDGALTPRSYVAPDPGITPLGVYMSGPCEPGSAPQVFVYYVEDFVGIYDDTGQGNAFRGRLDVIASGCVTNSTGEAIRVLVGRESLGDLGVGVYTEIDGSLYGAFWLALNIGIAVTPRIGGESLLIGTQIEVNDIVVSRFSVHAEVGTSTPSVSLEGRGLDSPTGLPIYSAGGDLDGDAALDIISLIERPQVDITDPRRYALWAALGRERQGERINGDFDLPTVGLRDPKMMVVDIDSDGTDDVIVGERTGGLGVSQTRFEIFSMSPR